LFWRLTTTICCRQALHDEIAAYARRAAGTEADLDRELEDSAVEELVSLDET